MNLQQIRFALEYSKDFNGTQAAIRAGYSPKSAYSQASELLKHPEVVAAIDDHVADAAKAAAITQAAVLRRWWEIANADPNELVQLRRVCCRHCYGLGHSYQWTVGEYARRLDESVEAGKPPPDGSGGFGFDPNAAPAPDCPECGGLGEEVIHLADTRKLSMSARRLYAGVQKTKDGVKVLMRDQDAALLNVARYLGMLVDRKEVSGPNGGPVPLVGLSAADLTDDQLAAMVGAGKADE